MNNFLIRFSPKMLFRRTLIKSKGKMFIGKNVKAVCCNIKVFPNGELLIEDGVVLKNVKLRVRGKCTIRKRAIVSGVREQLKFSVNGTCEIGSYSKLCARVDVRFGGKFLMGSHSNINFDSEVRADEFVSIGDYSRFSYGVHIWDTNTHNIYSEEKRRKLTSENFPRFGYEYEKPITKPVFIGNDCWIGKDVMIMKGSIVNDGAIVGTHTILNNKEVPANMVVVQKNELCFFEKRVSK